MPVSGASVRRELPRGTPAAVREDCEDGGDTDTEIGSDEPERCEHGTPEARDDDRVFAVVETAGRVR